MLHLIWIGFLLALGFFLFKVVAGITAGAAIIAAEERRERTEREERAGKRLLDPTLPPARPRAPTGPASPEQRFPNPWLDARAAARDEAVGLLAANAGAKVRRP